MGDNFPPSFWVGGKLLDNQNLAYFPALSVKIALFTLVFISDIV